MPDNFLRTAPFAPAAYGLQRAVFQDMVRRIDKSQKPLVIILEPQCQTYDTEPEAGTQDKDMPGPHCPDDAIVKEPESEIAVVGILMMSQRSCKVENIPDNLRAQTETL
jgi:hypothetical protein